MNLNKAPLFIFIASLLLPVCKVEALTMKEFSNACEQFSRKCTEHPVLNAYVGGALDLIATLNEKTNYLNKQPYCKDPKDIFKVPKIIEFMQEHSNEYINENAMMVFMMYFESHGGCHEK